MDNAVARLVSNAEKLQASGESMGDLFEVSKLRREDFRFHDGRTEGDDVFQAGNEPSTRTDRGHQGPAAFLIKASGLDKHGIGSEKPLRYSHLDIAASSGHLPHNATGQPVVALAKRYLHDQFDALASNDIPEGK